ncbi:MAG: YdeI/OmpD-associated family protein [Fimbriimonadaceae bacterium]|nr:YdeI/OmpD-associated family protein [Fimbriimonadaceae bacterium]
MRLPFDPDEAWGTKERHHVRGTLDGVAFRGPLVRLEDGWAIAPGAAWLRDCPLEEGLEVSVTIEAEGPQADDLPPDFAAALAAEPEARAFFDALATFYRKGYLKWLDGAKKPAEKRSARIAEIVTLLKAGHKQRPRS